jgi:hypothetical protein
LGENCLDMVTFTVTISRDVGQMAAGKKPREALVESVE